jgi:hypothetical protein
MDESSDIEDSDEEVKKQEDDDVEPLPSGMGVRPSIKEINSISEEPITEDDAEPKKN